VVRTAVAIGEPALAEHLAAGGPPKVPIDAAAKATITAILTEARGDLQSAADAYADAAGRWERLGVVPEQAFALLGEGRCVATLGRSSEALPVLQQARQIFTRLGAAPALAETDALLATLG
jgi:hypothetical protein